MRLGRQQTAQSSVKVWRGPPLGSTNTSLSSPQNAQLYVTVLILHAIRSIAAAWFANESTGTPKRSSDSKAIDEPHLSGLTSWLLTGRKPSFVSLKKGAACLLEFREQPKAGAATLVWALTPSQLRQLGG